MMKKVYTGLKAEKVDFGSYDMVIATSPPPGCIQVVANLSDGTRCINDPDTTSYMWVLNNPYGD